MMTTEIMAQYQQLTVETGGRRLRHVKIADEKYVDVILVYMFVKD